MKANVTLRKPLDEHTTLKVHVKVGPMVWVRMVAGIVLLRSAARTLGCRIEIKTEPESTP